MPVDASIYSQIQPAAAPNPLASLAQAYQIQALQQKIGEGEREAQANNRLLQLVGNPEFQTSDVATRAAKLQGIGDFKRAGELITTDAAANKDRRAAATSDFDLKVKQLDALSNLAGSVTDQTSYDRARQIAGTQLGIDISSWSPQYNPAGVQQFAQATLSAKDRLLAQQKALDQQITVAGQKLTAETSRANNADTVAVQRDRLNFDKTQPQGQVVQTDGGTVLVDRRTGEARPVTENGVPVQKPGKDIPANVNKSIIDNQQNLSRIDQAISAIQARPSAIGTINAIPGVETIRQYTDPEGVAARAGVADVGSLILHDRSGAAVTASEFPRLKPFIPMASDTPDVAVKKLTRFKELYQQEADLLAQSYSKDQGYKESPLLKSRETPKASPSGVMSVTNAADYAKVPSGATYTTPDGKTRRKP